jgi:hypothetical protein
MFKVAVGHSNDPDSLEAINETIEQCQQSLDGEIPQAGILFAAIDFEHSLILQRINETFPNIELIGGTTDGEVSSVLEFQQDSITLMLFCSDEIEIRASIGRNVSEDPYADSIVSGLINASKFQSFIENSDWNTSSELFSIYMAGLYLAFTGKNFDNHLRVVEKSTENAEYAILLHEMFPDSRFLHIVRNPYAALVAIRRYKSVGDRYPFLKDAIFSLKNYYYHLYYDLQYTEYESDK